MPTELNIGLLSLSDDERFTLMIKANHEASEKYDARYNQHLSNAERDAGFDRWREIALVLCPMGQQDWVVQRPSWRAEEPFDPDLGLPGLGL